MVRWCGDHSCLAVFLLPTTYVALPSDAPHVDSPAHGEPTGASAWGGAAASPSLVTRSGTSQGLGGHLTDVSGTPRTLIAPRRSPPRLRRPPRWWWRKAQALTAL